MDGVYIYFVNKLFLVGRYWDLKFDENGENFIKRGENNVGKGEIARFEQILIFPQCFQQTCLYWGLTPL